MWFMSGHGTAAGAFFPLLENIVALQNGHGIWVVPAGFGQKTSGIARVKASVVGRSAASFSAALVCRRFPFLR